jgi:hypothetical protein
MILSLVVLACAGQVQATIVHHLSYTPTSLPSEQGWEYKFEDYVAEEDAYTVEDGVLKLDTLEDGEFAFCFYEHDLPVDAAVTHVSASFHVRVSHTTPEDDDFALSLAFAYTVPGGTGRSVMISLASNAIDLYDDHPGYSIDATQWRNYLIVTELNTGICRLSIDGVFFREWAEPEDDTVCGVLFGDNYRPNNVGAEVAAVDIWLSSGDAVASQRHSWSAVKNLFAE